MFTLKNKALFFLSVPVLLLNIRGGIYSQTKPVTIRFGIYTEKIINSNKTDFDESLKQWVSGIQENTKIDWLAKSKILKTLYDSKTQFIEDIISMRTDFMNLSSLDFFELGLSNIITPILTPSKKLDDKYDRYLLINNSGDEEDDISKISDAEIVIPNSYMRALMKIWLRVELHDRIVGKKRNNITIVQSDNNENEVLHSVFFGNARFAVVREITFLTAIELNPQLKKKIHILDKSKNLIYYFLGHRKNLDPAISSAILSEGLNLHKSAYGRQILNIALTECLHPLELSDLKETENLIKRYNIIFKEKTRDNK